MADKLITLMELFLKAESAFLNSRWARLRKEECVRKQDFDQAIKYRQLENDAESEIENMRQELNNHFTTTLKGE